MRSLPPATQLHGVSVLRWLLFVRRGLAGRLTYDGGSDGVQFGVASSCVAAQARHQSSEAIVARRFIGKLSRGEAAAFTAPSIRRVFWDGAYCTILVLPGGRYLRLS